MSINKRLKEKRLSLSLTLEDVAKIVGITRQTIQRYESGVISNIPSDKIELLAKALQTTPAYLMGWEEENDISDMFESEEITYYEILGSVRAGYDGTAIEEHTGEMTPIPTAFLRGHKKEDFFVLRVSGNSMYPKLIDGDLVFVQRCASVDSGSTAVIIYNGDDATVKKVKYVNGEDWVEMIPCNPEYQTKRIEGNDLKECRVIGKVIKLIRDI